MLAEGSDGSRPDGRGGPRHRARHRRRLLPFVLGGVVVLLVGAGAVVAVQRVTTPLGRPAVAATLVAGVPVTGSGPSLPWPAKGQGAVAVPALSFAAQSGPETPIPIASLTKITTAVVVLRDHPWRSVPRVRASR